MTIKHVKPKKIYEIVAEQLTEMIKNGEVTPGERLSSVQKLAEDFNVGRSAIREALSALKAMGLIEIRQGEGTFVKKIDHDLASHVIPSAQFMQKEDIRQLFEIRKIIETGAASLAAENRTEVDVQQLRLILDEMKRAAGDGDIGEKADIDFHMTIVNSTKNDMLCKLMETVSDTMQESMREARKLFLYSQKSKMEQLYDEHLSIYKAIENQDRQRAYEEMMAHIVGVEKGLFR
ncbi:FadR/GntR family transcriptional regulator [Desertibacillus haloalkaliphilus]|uniref:FadR/GntR family transcriptional regulator n=1 Tax=Desertibacillus haloalkaliphilus TaxID=1328930 RepID=UPI001C26A206|nr:FadR/GntR family transcriptional regulator [Desertibacillus haloalkaliphilus]MBU8907195.1 FadR family transcriptional regulator [Desertibacillus haloalkaliphilus]